MFATREFLLRARLDPDTLETWLEAGWLQPSRDGTAQRFSEVDLARARLIRDLEKDTGVNDEGITVVLELVDQVHGLRRTLHSLLAAICVQSESTRRRITAEMREAMWPGRTGQGPDQVLAPSSDPGGSGLPG
jgi:chaperone modulatory protein CbpM